MTLSGISAEFYIPFHERPNAITVTSQVAAARVAFDAASNVYSAYDSSGFADQGCSPPRLAFGSDNLLSDTVDGRGWGRIWATRGDTFGVSFIHQEVFFLRSLASAQHYSQVGYVGLSEGVAGYPGSDDTRSFFVVGSPTRDADRPRSGTRKFVMDRLEGSVLLPSGRTAHVTGSVQAGIDFGQNLITATVHLVGSEGSGLLPTDLSITLASANGIYNYSNYSPIFSLHAAAQLFGPTANEVGLALTFDSSVNFVSMFSDTGARSHIHVVASGHMEG